MHPRDFLTSAAVGLILVVAGLAIADSVRGCDRSDRPVAQTPTESTTTAPAEPGPNPRPEAPEGWPPGVLDGVLTFVDANSCRIRTVGLSGGRERPLRPYPTACNRLWAPRFGARIAYDISPFRFRIADLGHGQRDFGEYSLEQGGEVVWSVDGQRLAWCDLLGRGVEREVLGPARRLSFCPVAYTPDGGLVAASGDRLTAHGETRLQASGRIGFAQFGLDRSVAVLVDDARIERYRGGTLTGSVELPTLWTGEAPVLSPDTCGAAVPLENGVVVLSLGCLEGDVGSELPGHAAAWSPDGRWLAVAEPDAIVFHSLDGVREIRWPATAVQLAWRPS